MYYPHLTQPIVDATDLGELEDAVKAVAVELDGASPSRVVFVLSDIVLALRAAEGENTQWKLPMTLGMIRGRLAE